MTDKFPVGVGLQQGSSKSHRHGCADLRYNNLSSWCMLYAVDIVMRSTTELEEEARVEKGNERERE